MKVRAGVDAHRLHVANVVDKNVFFMTQKVVIVHSHDGDTVSMNVCFTDEAIIEIETILKRAATYVRSGGGLRTSANIDTVNLVLHNMTAM